MNIIFLDLDGVIYTDINNTNEEIESKVKLLSSITHMFNCTIVISSSKKELIDYELLTTDDNNLTYLFNLFNKYDIKVTGRTKSVRKYLNKNTYTDIWKEDEILLYLLEHKEIKHFCIIDDDDLSLLHKQSDLLKVKDYLVTTNYKLGLTKEDIPSIKKVLSKDNKYLK